MISNNIITLRTASGQIQTADVGESSQIDAVFYDLNGAQLSAESIVALSCTLRNEGDGSVINNRQDQDVLNQNGGTLDPSGAFTLRLSGLDNVLVNPDSKLESHIVSIEWQWIDTKGTDQVGLLNWRAFVSASPVTVPDQPLPPAWVG